MTTPKKKPNSSKTLPSPKNLKSLIKGTLLRQKGNLNTLVSKLKTFTAPQLIELKNYLEEMEDTINRSEISSAIEKVLAKHSNKETFAFPAHGLMFTLLAMFAGKTKLIPSIILSKSHSQRTPQEREEVDHYIKSIFNKKVTKDYSEGFEQTKETSIALICNNPRIEAKAEIKENLFKDDLSFREEKLAVYIRRTYGPEGLRHFLGLILGLEENYRQGYFEWSVNDHLERLGYRRKANGAFDPALKRTASEIIKIFTHLCVTSVRKNGKKHSINGEFLFVVSGFKLEIFDKEIINEKLKISATDFWYKNAFDNKDGKAPRYTKLLRKIVQENHRENPLTLYLAPLLAIFWRMQPEQKIKVQNVMEWCDLNTVGQYKLRDVRSLNASLNYMKEKGYLGRWVHNGKKEKLADNENPFDLYLILTPPEWFQNELELIRIKKESYAIERTDSPLTHEEFSEIFQKSNLTLIQFGQHLGITGQYVSLLKNGKRKISKNVIEKVRLFQNNRNKTDSP